MLLARERQIAKNPTPGWVIVIAVVMLAACNLPCRADDSKPQPPTTPAATSPAPTSTSAPAAAEEEEEEEETPAAMPKSGEQPPVSAVPAEPRSSGTPEDEAKVALFRADLHFTKGDKLFKQNQFLKAAVEFKEALKYQPKTLKYAEKWAEAAAQARNYPLAIEAYEALLKLDPSRKKDLSREIADCYLNMRQYDQACDKYKVAAETASDKGEIWRKVAQIRLGQNKQDEAMGAYRQAIKTDPHDGTSYTKLALMLWNLGKQDEAFALYREGVKNAPRDGDLQEGYAYALMSSKDYRGAAAAYKQAATLKGSTATINQGYQAALKFVEYEDQVAKQKAEQAAREAAKAKKKH